MDKYIKIKIDFKRAITPPCLLRIDRKVAYANTRKPGLQEGYLSVRPTDRFR